MKKNIYIHHDTKIQKGGGANFLSSLENYLKNKNKINTNFYLSGSYFINSFPFNSPLGFFLILLKAKTFNNILIYRVDGPISIYRINPNDLILDRFISIVASLSNHVFYQSNWSFENMRKLNKYYLVNNYSIIKNSYSFSDKKISFPIKKYKILISSWSKNWIKGFEVYEYVDFLVDKFKNIQVDFIGRSPIKFKNINDLGVMDNEKLKNLYSNYDIFLTASLFDPCSNSLAEAKSNKCLIIARDNGGHRELISKYDILFSSLSDLEKIFENLDFYFKRFKDNFSYINNQDKVCFEKYNELIEQTENLHFKNYIIGYPYFLLQFIRLIYLYILYNIQLKYFFKKYKKDFLFNFKKGDEYNLNHNSDYSQIINQIPIFLEIMHSRDNHYYRMTLSSDIKRKNLLYPQIYVLKLFKILSINNLYQKEKLINHILDNFLTLKKNKIFINDHDHIKRINIKSRIKNIFLRKTDIYYYQCSRADTRQSISALMDNDFNCSELIKILYVDDINQYLIELEKFSSFDNLESAWHEISHLSHLLFEISLLDIDNVLKNKEFVNYLNKIINTFCYYIGEIDMRNNDNRLFSDNQNHIKNLVNGLMKLFSGVKRINYIPNLPFEKIINILQKYKSQNNACDFLNTFYVMDYCLEQTKENYNNDICEYINYLINQIFNIYYFPEFGGFSFYSNTCQYSIYNSIIASKSKEPDIHGTLMFSWLLAFYGKITKNKSLMNLNILNT